MTRRNVHYEAAFEDYLRSRQLPFVPVDEARKIVLAGEKIKSFDFIVYGGGERKWLVDVKGRKFPYDLPEGKRFWENWVVREDLDGLAQWEESFGQGFLAMFLFAYLLTCPDEHQPTEDVYAFRGETYSFLGIPVNAYRQHARLRSPKWQTYSMPTAKFRELVQPIETLLQND